MFDNVQKIEPFGVVVQADDTPLEQVSIDEIRQLVEQNLLVVLRGFQNLDKEAFVAYARTWGLLLEWNFGEVLELEVIEEPKNYLFTTGDVPLHWDGAFAEQEPHYQLFQCLKAPLKGSGGETVFCDAMAPLNQPDPNWKEVSIAYRTDKMAHYGGEIRSPLITPHPESGKPRIRFAEPPGEDTADLNPLFLDIEGAGPELVETLREVLYHPDNCYHHAWQDGDFLLADNFSLLHGRTPFSAHSPRHIQRIHIL